MREFENLSNKELKKNIRSTKLNLKVSKREKDPAYIISMLENVLLQLIEEQNLRKEEETTK